MPILELESIRKAYDPKNPVLHNVSLAVEPGELFFLLGSSGCGKSTLLRIIAGLLHPDSGTVRIDGRDITDTAPEHRETPMVFQNYALWPHMDVYENIAFGLRARKLKQTEIDTRVREILATVRLEDCIHRKVPSLSGGQQQRIALARALALRPRLLLLDEPLSNLDAKLRDSMRLEIRRICKAQNLTAIYVTHDRKEALTIADRIAVMHRGVLRQTGTPRTLYTEPADAFVASFLGDANFIPATSRGDGSFETALGIFLPEETTPALPLGTRCTLLCRPEALRFHADRDDGNRFDATLVETAYLGDASECRLSCSGLTLQATEFDPPVRKIGETLRVSVPRTRIRVLPNAPETDSPC